MKKELIFTYILSVITSLFIIGGVFYAFSWYEPTSMPSSYETPLNTSATTQNKAGEIYATMFRDYSNGNYYVDPLGTSVLNNITSNKITSTATTSGDSSTTLTTKSYVDASSIVSVNSLFGYLHTKTECTSSGGTVTDIGLAHPICKFYNTDTCPGNWYQYHDWSTTQVADGPHGCCQPISGCTDNCPTGSHNWNDIPKESCHDAFCGTCGTCTTIYATTTEIGCY